VPAALGFAAALAAAPYDVERLAELRTRLEDGLRDAGAVIIGEDAPRIPTIGSAALPGASNAALLIQLDLAGIAVSAGSACSSGKMKASQVLAAMNVPDDIAGGFIRISFGPHTNGADVDRFLAEWRNIRSRQAQAA
jgi:cysteine desulfurase